jgi:hypothetical protein
MLMRVLALAVLLTAAVGPACAAEITPQAFDSSGLRESWHAME